MATIPSPASRFREFRERSGLSHDEIARQMAISTACIRDIESVEGELSSCYSPAEAKQFCRVLRVHPRELFGIETSELPITALELVQCVHDHCRLNGITLEQFEDTVGWHLVGIIDPPDQLLQDITIDGLQWLCRELGINWQRVILGL
jgi:hypothetical protein